MVSLDESKHKNDKQEPDGKQRGAHDHTIKVQPHTASLYPTQKYAELLKPARTNALCPIEHHLLKGPDSIFRETIGGLKTSFLKELSQVKVMLQQAKE
jgi:hypothetical protein